MSLPNYRQAQATWAALFFSQVSIMIKNLIAPIVAIAIGIALITTASFSLRADGASSEANQDYFIKSVQEDSVLIVEPNLLEYVLPSEMGDRTVDNLLDSIEEIRQDYTIRGTKRVKTERKGSLIPNLIVYVQPKVAKPDSD
ncbi:MAG: hypothetical protein ACFE0I_01900 [Elainellaceae cyanobacterium]